MPYMKLLVSILDELFAPCVILYFTYEFICGVFG